MIKYFFVFTIFISKSFLCYAQNVFANSNWHIISIYESSSKKTTNYNSKFPETCELNFKRDSVTINTCNAYILSYKIEKNIIVFDGYPPGMQLAYCDGGFSNRVEDFIFRQISEKPMTFTFRKDSLILKTSDSNIITCRRIK